MMSAPTSILAVGWTMIPLVLTRKTWPLAMSAPAMMLGSSPRTLLTACELVLGWTKVTDWLASILKLFQSMMSLSEV